MKVLSAAEMRSWEKELLSKGYEETDLMYTAGRNIAEVVRRRYFSFAPGGAFDRAVIICGGGNNGGDGVIAAMELERCCIVNCILTVPADKMSPTAKFFAERYANREIRPLPSGNEFPPGTVIIDALIGIGCEKPLRKNMRSWVDAVNSSGCPVVSVDVPTGMNCDTGKSCGKSPCVLPDLTIAAGAFKPCHLLAEDIGCLELVPIADKSNIPGNAPDAVNSVTEEDAAKIFRSRSVNGHKNLSGRVAVAAGSAAYSGAPVLAVQGAAAGGAGMIRLTLPEAALKGRCVPPEVILSALPGDILDESAFESISAAAGLSDVLLIGPGIGTAPQTGRVVQRLLQERRIPVIADADALNLLAGSPEWTRQGETPVILTPHPGEALRLAPETAKMDRISQAKAISAKYNAVVILKGSRSVIAAPDGRCSVNTSGSPVLATAGTGDVLAGFLAALLPGNDPFEAAAAAAWIHGRCGETSPSGRGTKAGDLPDLIVKYCVKNFKVY